jgi:hypothetical protein
LYSQQQQEQRAAVQASAGPPLAERSPAAAVQPTRNLLAVCAHAF